MQVDIGAFDLTLDNNTSLSSSSVSPIDTGIAISSEAPTTERPQTGPMDKEVSNSVGTKLQPYDTLTLS
jgi:hypothetical protein